MKRQDFLKGSLILMVSAAAAKLLGAVFRIPLTNMLGGVGMSCFSCAYTIFLPVYSFITAGISSSVAHMTARSRALGLGGDTLRIRRTAIAVFSAAGLLGSVMILLLAVPFSRWSCGSDEAVPAIMMIAPVVLTGCIVSAERGYYEGMSDMYPTAVSQTVEGAVRAAAGLLLCGYTVRHGDELLRCFPQLDDVRPLAAAAGILGVTLGSFGALLFFGALRLFPGCVPENRVTSQMRRRETAAELVRTALPAGIGAVVTNLSAVVDMCTVIMCVRVPEVMPAGVLPEDYPRFVYGSFAGMALTVFNLVPGITNMLGKGILPPVTEAWASGRSEELERRSVQALFTAAAAAVPCAAGLGLLSGQVLAVLFPERAAEAAVCTGALRLLMPGMVFLCLSFPLFSMLQAIGRPADQVRIMLAGTAVKLCGNLALVPHMGAAGAAVSTSVCYAVILVLALHRYCSCTGVRLRTGSFAAVAYSGVLCAGAAYLAMSIAGRCGGGALVQTVSAAAAGGAAYITALSATARRELFPEKNTTGSRRAAC
ncbi:MAG: polysaccharide biosynthesis C-terminal domain-containing protein [Ruminococcus sp.]|nr:polysaccharide biosynthesis C-terminal domain-containing protein [Ruminococcus sp.]